ncbi:MAG: c-type cytochrome biogenesis protein CcmI [Gammaproteobacteria bacterium]|nr:c-type cytochrome biogenesis protein CcmI [Gammaproteobacteria bacterium]
MTVFLLSAAAMLVVALALVLPPLLGRARAVEAHRDRLNLAVHRDRVAELEQQESDGELGRDQAQEARLEIERDLLRDSEVRSGTRATRQAPRWAAVLVALAIPASAIWLYAELGTPAALQGTLEAPQSAAGARGVPGEHSMTDLIAGLIRKLQEDPNNLQGWVMLGRSYNALERFAEAREAFGAAARLAPRDAEVLTRLAEATALANDGDLSGKPEEILHEVLAIDSRAPTALWLSGLAASQRQQYAEAIGYWETLEQVVTSAEEKATVAQYLVEARKQVAPPETSSEAAPAPSVPEAQTTPAVAVLAPAAVTVRVTLAPELQDRVAAGDAVFVYARPAEGARMPLAIVRHTAAELPLTVTLDDRAVMSGGAKLSAIPQVVVGARVSRSGNAIPQTGDLEGQSEAVSPAASPTVDVRIDHPI